MQRRTPVPLSRPGLSLAVLVLTAADNLHELLDVNAHCIVEWRVVGGGWWPASPVREGEEQKGEGRQPGQDGRKENRPQTPKSRPLLSSPLLLIHFQDPDSVIWFPVS